MQGAALALVAGIIGYAATGRWRGKEPAPGAAGSDGALPPASSPNAPPVAPLSPSPASLSAESPQADFPGPRIRFAGQVYDFGKANGDSLVDCSFVFTNTGGRMLEITDVTSACSCMKIGEWSHQVEPGKTGTIAVQYNSRFYTGRFAKSVYVTCNDTNQPKVTLEITGTVWRPIEITPPTAVLNLSAETPSNATTVRLISHLEEPLTFSDLKVTSSAFAVELQTNQSGKEYQLFVRTAPPYPTNSQQGQITLKPSATNLPAIQINAFANVQPILMPTPRQLRLPALPLTNAFTGTVWIRNNGTNALTVSDPVVNAPGVEVQIKEDQPGQLITVTVNFPAGFEFPSGQSVELRLKTSHPQFPVIQVPIIPTPRAASVETQTPARTLQTAPLPQTPGR